jgi:hypothetical protein
MKTRFASLLILAFLVALPVFSQHGGGHGPGTPRANQGHLPPPPPARTEGRAAPEIERHDANRINSTPHVNHDHWYGHEEPNDARFHMDHPFEHGRFEHFGPSYRYGVLRFDRDHHRFWFPGGFGFEVAAWDWPLCADWCWDCGDDFVVYDDTDHPGWYLLYNVHTGVYVHVNYLGT